MAIEPLGPFFGLPGALGVCTNSVSAFATSLRESELLWTMILLLPQSMSNTTGVSLIKSLVMTEHSLRPLRPATVLRTALLDRRRAVELGTADAYQLALGTRRTTIGDTDTLELTAGELAAKLRFTLG